ncbi:MAG: cytochrome c [Rhodanobacteraceae bacterium]
MKRFLLTAACLAATLLASGNALAKGDKAHGRTMVYTCHGCHGVPGYENAYPNYRVPRIAGQNYQYLKTALNEYRNGNRSHPTMQAQAQSLSEQDIDDIATYLSGLKPAK